jgi:hypothetical protein
MSVHVFFMFSAGLAKPIQVPKGTIDEIMSHVRDVEQKLQLKTTQYKDNPKHWDHWAYKQFQHITDDKLLCTTISNHNSWVRWLYDRLGEWTKNPPSPSEELTPEKAQEFWHGLQTFNVPLERWTKDYFKERMQHYHDVMRGIESEGVSFNAKPLKPEQSDAVMCLFSDILDTHDCRAAVPVGHDHVAFSDDGGYSWCEKCGAIDADEVDHRIDHCRKRGGCPLRRDYGE